MKIIYDFQIMGMISRLTEACERLAVLQAAGVDVPLVTLRVARDELVRINAADVSLETAMPALPPVQAPPTEDPPVTEDPELHSEAEPDRPLSAIAALKEFEGRDKDEIVF